MATALVAGHAIRLVLLAPLALARPGLGRQARAEAAALRAVVGDRPTPEKNASGSVVS